jgi:hypothetical protein
MPRGSLSHGAFRLLKRVVVKRSGRARRYSRADLDRLLTSAGFASPEERLLPGRIALIARRG